MADLPHSNVGYVQAEETDFRRSTDQEVYTKVGSDQNYLIDQSLAAQSLANSLFMTTSQWVQSSAGFTTDGSGNFEGVVATTPNGKPITMVFAQVACGGYGLVYCLILIGQSNVPSTMAMWPGGSTPPSSQGNYPLLTIQVTGTNNEQLYAKVANGTIVGTKGTNPTWAAHTGGAVYWGMVYAT